MNDTVVEYVNGIEVIKAFNQSTASYKKYEDAVTDNASFFYNWMKSCQWPMSAYTAICPSTLLTVLPMGCLFYRNGTLTSETFVMIMIVSMSIIGPILAASNFIDSIAAMADLLFFWILYIVALESGNIWILPVRQPNLVRQLVENHPHQSCKLPGTLCRRSRMRLFFTEGLRSAYRKETD